MIQTNFVELVRSEQLDALDEAWTAALAEPPAETDSCCEALRALCKRDMASIALPMASSMVESLVGKDRHADAFEVGMTLVRLEAHNERLARQLVDLVEHRFGSESWYSIIRELSELDNPDKTADALVTFEKMRRYTVGHVIYHRAGWGTGLVEEFHAASRDVVVRFANGRTQELPLQTALDSMIPLDSEDLRSMLLIAKDKLEELAANEPSVLIRKAAKMYRGRVNSSEVKSLLSPDLIPTKKWASFWKKAKAAAATDPYLQVEGSTTRPVFELRKKPLTLADEARRTLGHCDDLGEQVAQIREYLERSNDPAAQATILEIAQERIDAAANEGKASHAHTLDGILLLEKHDRHPATSAATELKAMLVGEGEEFRPENFDQLATQDARDHAVVLLPEALGEDWAEQCVAKLLRAPASVVEGIVQLLTDKGHAASLLCHWDQVAPYPQRHPILTYLLGRLYADGKFDGQENAPSRVAVARVLLHLARVLSGTRRGDTASSRLLNRVTSLLTGRRDFLKNLLQEVTKADMASYLGISERGGEDFPTEITDQILRGVSARFPELTAKPEKPYWEEDAIYTTAAGLERQRAEYRKLVDELIPANSKAIGAAASLGDLSENSEWEAAMEEQRNLTGRATIMDEELRKAKLLENANIPDSVAAPGTAVTFSSQVTAETRTYRILGPWDITGDDVINYKAPLAQALLGKTVGDTISLPTETGEETVRIDAVERVM